MKGFQPQEHTFNVIVPQGTTLEQCEMEKTKKHVGIFFFEESVWDGDRKALSSSDSD